ncbi:MAG: class I SAM-dependent methyltransferase [Pseudomonadota bacterium]
MTTRPTRKKRPQTLAQTADKYDCYQQSVQSPDVDIEFFEQAYKDAYGRTPYTLREDFCGTFSVCCEWAKSNAKRTAIGVDLCPEALQWGRDNNLAALTKAQQARVAVYQKDVRTASERKSDIVAAQNFSFWIFRTRAEMVDYFKIARANLKDEGVMVMDMMGGGDSFLEGHVEKRKIAKGPKGFSYHWEQAEINPVTLECTHYIHFKFGDGSKMKRAFEYSWRFWSIPEIREMLEEAGFSKSIVYWEQEDEDGEDTGEWAPGENAPSYPSWICYLVAVR